MLVEAPSNPQKIIGRVSAQAMLHEDFRARLAADPVAVLNEEGLEVPDEMNVEILTSFDDVPADQDAGTMYLVIPEADELSHEDLSIATVAAASCQTTASTACTTPSCVSTASSASTNSCN